MPTINIFAEFHKKNHKKMGKGWKYGGGGRRGGGGGSSGGATSERPGYGRQGAHHDLSSCRGHSVILGTCDSARERETSKELVNLITQVIEEIYPAQNDPSAATGTSSARKEDTSIAAMIQQEIASVKSSSSQRPVVSIQTGVKGIVIIKLLQRKHSAVVIVKEIFDRVRREKQAYTRHVVRLIPLEGVCYPREDELEEESKRILGKALSIEFPKIPRAHRPPEEDAIDDDHANKKQKLDDKQSEGEGDGDEGQEIAVPAEATVVLTDLERFGSSSGRSVKYLIQFKARNNNVLKKDEVYTLINKMLRPHGGRPDFLNPEVRVSFTRYVV